MIRERWFISLLVCVAALVAAAPSSAETLVLAEFVGGGSNASPVTDVVDAYTGMEGDGWTGPWVEAKTATTHTVTTSTANPLYTAPGGDQKYLDLTVAQNAATSVKYGVTARDYNDGIDITKPHAIDFKYRIDETLLNSTTFTTFDDRYQIFDASAGNNTVNPSSSWVISCYGGTHSALPAEKVGKWIVYDGGGHDATPDTGFSDARNINTGITVASGTVYDFHVTVDPATYAYDVTISSEGTELYDSKDAFPDGLGWRTSNATVAGMVHFNACCKTGNDVREYSFDALRIVPEPSVVALLISAALALASCARRG